MVVRQGRESYAASRRQPARARSRRALARAQISYTMPSDTHTQNEMMSQLEALEEALTDNCSVSGGDDSSVIGPGDDRSQPEPSGPRFAARGGGGSPPRGLSMLFSFPLGLSSTQGP